jgi:SAM-dependent methyltransferase
LGDFDFAHIPVGLLSQVYEAFCWKWEHSNAKKNSVYYTPRNIAATLVEEAFHNIEDAAGCRVLDPACGAGVFLVLALRRIYRERWKATGNRPDTSAIREILESQLTGFDISTAALKLAALSLYLTAIEIDPIPVPPEKLKFKQLRERVLFNFRPQDEPLDKMVIGSLGPHVHSQFDGQFDLVLSNPPWTSLPKEEKALAAQLTTVSQQIIANKGDADIAQDYRNPDSAPDLPFLWKSTEWCKPHGRIAMALPSRILLKQEPIPSQARNTLLKTIEVTGIINGSNLSDTKVWPGMSQPFMLLFARNRPPSLNHLIRFITPYCETALNRHGEVRIDFKSAQPIEAHATAEEPWLWKALTVGTSLDVDVIRRLHGAGGKPLGKYWEEDLGLTSGAGYMLKRDQKQEDATFLHSLPNLRGVPRGKFLVDTGNLLPFAHPTASRPRTLELYTAPLVLIKQAPGPDRHKAWALLSFSNVAFNQTFHGYSSASHPQSQLLARYLHLFANSLIRMHYALVTRPRFGAERRVLDKSDLDQCPIIPLESLSTSQCEEILALSERLLAGDTAVFEEIDQFFGRLYGLDELDLEVIRDTLNVSLPFNASRERASRSPTTEERESFRRRLDSLLQPFFSALGKRPTFAWERTNFRPAVNAPFSTLTIFEEGTSPSSQDDLFQNQILPLANDTGTTRIILEVGRGLVIGLMNQYRFWTLSRARLLAAEILRQHMGVFETG